MSVGFGGQLREFRQRIAWSQEELAERSGLSRHAVSMLESGQRRPRLSSVARLSEALALDPAERHRLIASARAGTDTSGDGATSPGMVSGHLGPRQLPRDTAMASGVPEPTNPDDRTPPDLPGEHPSAVAALAQLPSDTRVFTGRENEVAQLTALVRDLTAADDEAVVIVAIDGMAGVGKSALAVRAAHLLADRFPDGQLFLDLHGYSQDLAPLDPADALVSLLTSLQVPPGQIPADPDARAAALRARLAGTRTLILLDNAATEAQVRPLIPGNGGCLVLITSRKQFKALDEAHTLALDVLPQPDAIALLQTLVKPERASTQDAAWLQIAELCGCLPLALRIAAALLRHRPAWTLHHLVGKLSATLLEPGSFTDGERDLSAVFNLSYQTLDDAQRVLLRRLGLVPGPDIDAYAVAALLDTDRARAERLLQGLVDHHLLSEPAADRYRMHDLVRAYARAQAIAVDTRTERDQSLGQLLRYYAHTAQSASHVISRHPRPQPSGPTPGHRPNLRDPKNARTWLQTEYPNLDAAFTYAHAHHLDHHTVALSAGLAEVLSVKGPWTRALEVHHTAAEAAGRLAQLDAHAAALLDLGRVLQLTGDFPGSMDALDRALRIDREIGDHSGEANALADLGRVLHLAGDFPGAMDALDRALRIDREIGDHSGEANALSALGLVLQVTGDLAGADDAYTQALEIYRETGNRNGEAAALTILGRIRRLTGDLTGAMDALDRALRIDREIGHSRAEANALTDLGRLLQLTGNHTGATSALTKALAVFRETGHRRGEAYTLTCLGSVLQLTGDLAGATSALARALNLFREAGERGNEAWALNHYAAAIAATGDRPQALGLYHQALTMNRELNKPDDEAISLEGIGDHHLAIGDTLEGAARLCQALTIYQRLGMGTEVQRVQLRLADLVSP